MSATVYFTRNYENGPLRSLQQNKANQTQFVFFTADSADQTQSVGQNKGTAGIKNTCRSEENYV